MPQLTANHYRMKGPANSGAPQGAASAGMHASRPRRRILRVAGVVLACLLGGGLAFMGGFAAFATHVSRLTAPAEPGMADAIIVLTGGQARIDTAVGLLKSGKGQRLLISGVNPAARLVDLQRATGGDAGLFSCCVDIDRAALDTIGNAAESAKWVNSHAFARVIVVTNNYHMPRSLLELKRMIDDTDLVPYPVVNTPLDRGEWLTNGDALRVLFTEYAKYLAAVARGMVPGVSGESGATLEASAAGAAR